MFHVDKMAARLSSVNQNFYYFWDDGFLVHMPIIAAPSIPP